MYAYKNIKSGFIIKTNKRILRIRKVRKIGVSNYIIIINWKSSEIYVYKYHLNNKNIFKSEINILKTKSGLMRDRMLDAKLVFKFLYNYFEYFSDSPLWIICSRSTDRKFECLEMFEIIRKDNLKINLSCLICLKALISLFLTWFCI